MKIINSIDLSREGNDCWINEEWVLCSIFDEEIILHILNDSYACKITSYTLDEWKHIPTKIYSQFFLSRSEIETIKYC